MARLPNKKYRLTDEELDVVRKIAHITRCDESWFSITDEDHKNFNKDYDTIYDLEHNRIVSLQFGLKLLRESYEADPLNELTMTEDEKKTWVELFEKIS